MQINNLLTIMDRLKEKVSDVGDRPFIVIDHDESGHIRCVRKDIPPLYKTVFTFSSIKELLDYLSENN